MLQFGQKANEAQLGDIMDKFTTASLAPAVAYEVPVHKRIIDVTVDQTGTAFAINFPHAAKCPNAVITLKSSIAAANPAKVLTVNIPGSTALTSTSNTTGAAIVSKILLYSDGDSWHSIGSAISTAQ